jgi:hypothetical protein
MTRTTISLIDVLEPPANMWLRKLGRRAAELPVGVRVVRFSENDDDTGIELVDAQNVQARAAPKKASTRDAQPIRSKTERMAA